MSLWYFILMLPDWRRSEKHLGTIIALFQGSAWVPGHIIPQRSQFQDFIKDHGGGFAIFIIYSPPPQRIQRSRLTDDMAMESANWAMLRGPGVAR